VKKIKIKIKIVLFLNKEKNDYIESYDNYKKIKYD